MYRNDRTDGNPQNFSAPVLLRAAFELVGSNKVLAELLGTSQSLLIKYMSGRDEDVPRHIVLRAIDILLGHRASDETSQPN